MHTARLPAHTGHNQKQETTGHPGEYITQWLSQAEKPANSLIILDIDDTILTTPQGQWLGNSQMFYTLLEQALVDNPNWSRLQAAEHIDTLLLAIYPRVPFSLTDPELPLALDQARQQGARVLGMTSRGLSMKAVTHWQIDQAGIHFSTTGSPKQMKLDHSRFSILEQGIAFVSHGNRKGEVLAHMLTEETAILPDIERILVIDDRQKHLDDIAATVTSIPVTTVLCTCPASQRVYQPEIAKQQLKTFLHHWRNDTFIQNLLKTNAYAQSFLNET